MSGLVAYGDNSSSEDEDEGEGVKSTVIQGSSKLNHPDTEEVSSSSSEKLKQAFSLRFEDLLPKPKSEETATLPIQQFVIDAEEIGPIPPKKVYGDEEVPPPPQGVTARVGIGSDGRTEVTSKRSAAGIMQISIPSLKEFENDSDDEESSRKKKFTNSGPKKGSGLFAILPEPKGGTILPPKFSKTSTTEIGTGNTSSFFISSTTTPSSKPSFSLIPHSVQQSMAGKRPAADASDRLAAVRAKYMKQESNFKIVSKKKVAKARGGDENSGDSSEEDNPKPMDFFSLDESAHQVDITGINLDDYRIPESAPPVEEDPGEMEVDQQGHEDDLPAPSFSEQPPQEDIMKYIQPDRKYRGKAQQPELNIIDVRADDLRPDTTEWLKTITDKSIIPPRKANLPGGMSKRKHQITYLAAEAKAREEELQNQWAANRHSKRQTQNKYGF